MARPAGSGNLTSLALPCSPTRPTGPRVICGDFLYTHPAVLEAAVVGQPDPVFGEQPVAFVTLRPGFDIVPEDLIEHCRQSLARYKVPRKVYVQEVLPKNAVGKIAKPVLRERLKDAGAPAPEPRRST